MDTGSMRLFVAAPLHEGAEIRATPEQAHHLGAVMRRAAGDALRLFNGQDGEWAATYRPEGKRQAVLEVGALLRAQAPEPDLWLVFAPLKRDATDLLVQKATELGVSAVQPVFTRRTIAGRVNLDRLAAIAEEAAVQCERLTVPRVGEPVDLASLLHAWPSGRRLVAAVERKAARPIRPGLPAGLLIGPEGGYAPEEVELLHRHPFVELITLGPRILRAETAGIVGLALLQADWAGGCDLPNGQG